MRNSPWSRAAGVAVLLGIAQPAAADEPMIVEDTSTHERAMHADVFVMAGFFGYSHMGFGGWFSFPILPDGFIPSLNDALFVEAGGALERYSWDVGNEITNCSYAWWRLTPMAGVRWAFYLTPEWTVYGTAKLGYGVGFGSSVDCGGYSAGTAPNYTYPAFDGAVGAYWKFSPDWQVRLELGYFGVTVGAGTDLSR